MTKYNTLKSAMEADDPFLKYFNENQTIIISRFKIISFLHFFRKVSVIPLPLELKVMLHIKKERNCKSKIV